MGAPEEERVQQLRFPVEMHTLANGLRVVISPDGTAPVVTVGVYYNIGFRLEPRGRSGFAHLFEGFEIHHQAGSHVQLRHAGNRTCALRFPGTTALTCRFPS